MILILTILLWFLYSLVEGKREAQYFSLKVKATINEKKLMWGRDEHNLFTLQRGTVVAMIAFLMLACGINILDCVIFVICMCATFPFIHDGEYYITRGKLDGIYPKGWFDQSTTSTAKADKFNIFNPVSRTIFFGIGIAGFVYEIIKNW